MGASKDYYVLPGQYHCPGECPGNDCLMMDAVVLKSELFRPTPYSFSALLCVTSPLPTVSPGFLLGLTHGKSTEGT